MQKPDADVTTVDPWNVYVDKEIIIFWRRSLLPQTKTWPPLNIASPSCICLFLSPTYPKISVTLIVTDDNDIFSINRGTI